MKAKDFLGMFEEDLFHPDVPAKNKTAALEAMVDFLYSKKRINNRQAVLTTLLEREKLGSTGIGKGVAIPHSRSMMVERLTICFGRLEEPIEFDAIDKKPVQLLFLILAPPQDVGNEYLPFIGKLVEVVKEKKNRDALRTAKEFRQFVGALEKAV